MFDGASFGFIVDSHKWSACHSAIAEMCMRSFVGALQSNCMEVALHSFAQLHFARGVVTVFLHADGGTALVC